MSALSIRISSSQASKPTRLHSREAKAENLLYVTMTSSHPLVKEHIRAGGKAVVLEAGMNGDMITIYDNEMHMPVLWTHLIPATIEGKALHNVQNACANSHKAKNFESAWGA